MENESPKWYLNLVTRFNEMANSLGVEGPVADELRTFVFDVAKEQYKIGNKCGIAFALSDKGKAYFAAKS